jgi:hypothetical protein
MGSECRQSLASMTDHELYIRWTRRAWLISF